MKYKLLHRMRQVWKNTWNHMLMLSLLALGACSNDGVIPSVIDPVIPTDTAYISLNLNLTDHILTKSYIGEDSGTVSENYVNSVRIVLYNGDGSASTVIECMDFNIQTDESNTEYWLDNSTDKKDLAPRDNKERLITYARKVPHMDYKMLVIVNVNNELQRLTEKGHTYQEVLNAYKAETGTGKSANTGGLASDRNFLMTNADGALVNISKEALCATTNAAHNNPVSVTVARVVAKVTLTLPEGLSSIPINIGAEIDSVQWELDITNRYTFWMKKSNSTDDRANEYGEDPNYDNFGIKTESERAEHFFYYSSLNQELPEFIYKLNGSEYCLENTMNLDDQKKDNVITRAIVRCIYKPANIETIGESFYIYNSYTYSEKEMQLFAEEAEKRPTPILDGLYKAIIDAKNSDYSFLDGAPKQNGNVVTKPFNIEGITYYYKGINYYAIKILHLGENDTPNPTEGYYGVVRNTHYTIQVDKIQGPGSPSILWDDIVTRSSSGDHTANYRLYNNIETSIRVE